MLRLILFLGLAASLAEGANAAGPSRFYIVSVFDHYDYYRIIDVKSDGPDSIVRYVRIAPRNPECSWKIVQAAETRVHDVAPAQLAQQSNLCAMKPRILRSAIKQLAKPNTAEKYTTFGIVMQCGSRSVSLELPSASRIDFERMQSLHPSLAHLWDLASAVTEQSFGSKDIFINRNDKDDLALQRKGQELIPALSDGRYELGLKAALKPERGWGHPTFRSILAGYIGPLGISESDSTPRLLNPEQYTFTQYVAPSYPPLAKQALIQGIVDLLLKVDKASGKINDVTVLVSHPLLKDAAIAAVKKWRFAPNSVVSETVRVTLQFEIRCPRGSMS